MLNLTAKSQSDNKRQHWVMGVFSSLSQLRSLCICWPWTHRRCRAVVECGSQLKLEFAKGVVSTRVLCHRHGLFLLERTVGTGMNGADLVQTHFQVLLCSWAFGLLYCQHLAVFLIACYCIFELLRLLNVETLFSF